MAGEPLKRMTESGGKKRGLCPWATEFEGRGLVQLQLGAARVYQLGVIVHIKGNQSRGGGLSEESFGRFLKGWRKKGLSVRGRNGDQ